MKVSIVIPTNNEMKLAILPKILSTFASHSDCEVICVDSYSMDGTQELIQNSGAKLLLTQDKHRSQKLNLGAVQASGELILFHHPRSMVEKPGINHLIENSSSLAWGGFTHTFKNDHPLLKWTSFYSNFVRPKISGILYLDHCIFVNRNLYGQLGADPFGTDPIFEDTCLTSKLAKHGKPTLLPYLAETSPVRYLQNGIIRQATLNQLLKVGYHMKFSRDLMNKIYERNLNLN